jgi:hypothetical protein
MFLYNANERDKVEAKTVNSVAWVRERTIPSDRRLSTKLVPPFADRGCHVVSVTDPHGRIIFLDRSRYFFFQVAPQLYSRGSVDPVQDPLLLRKSGSGGNRTRICFVLIFAYLPPPRWLRLLQGVRVPQIEYHWTREKLLTCFIHCRPQTGCCVFSNKLWSTEAWLSTEAKCSSYLLHYTR